MNFILYCLLFLLGYSLSKLSEGGVLPVSTTLLMVLIFITGFIIGSLN